MRLRSFPIPLLVLSAALAVPASAQRTAPSSAPGTARSPNALAPPGWYSGDLHEHVQSCDDTVHPLSEIRERMDEEDLDVVSVLVWERAAVPFKQSICRVVGHPDESSASTRILQFGVETSGLTCARWGHLSAVGIGPDEARIATGSIAGGDCADMPGLGLGGDGSGFLNAPVAQVFFTHPGALCGYAHAVWTAGLYQPEGYDWLGELLATGFTTDTRYLAPAQKLAFPNRERLFTDVEGTIGTIRAFFPLLASVDVALGEAQYIEAIYSGTSFPLPTTPPAEWSSLYYKLLTAGLRVSLAGGSDRACFPPPGDSTPMRTYAHVENLLSFGTWTKAIADGRTTISLGNDVFLRMTLDGAEIGDDVYLEGPSSLEAHVELCSTRPITDTIEIVVNGEVAATRAFTLDDEGTAEFLVDLPLESSAWVAARLGSQRAHTGSLQVYVADRPITDPVTDEYWMVWCDVIEHEAMLQQDVRFFGDQEAEAFERIDRARRVFRTLRDVDGLDPTWNAGRLGVSTPSCRGPITIGVDGPPRVARPSVFTCVNAPPLAEGALLLSRAAEPAGPCRGGMRTFVATDPDSLVSIVPVHSTRSGLAEATFVPGVDDAGPLYAQFVWRNPRFCEGHGCGATPTDLAASDALALVVDKTVDEQ